jgi:hypothetical protein
VVINKGNKRDGQKLGNSTKGLRETNQPTVKWILPNQLGLLVSATPWDKREEYKGPTKHGGIRIY